LLDIEVEEAVRLELTRKIGTSARPIAAS